MGTAAYNRGSRAISLQIDMEIQQRREESSKRVLRPQAPRPGLIYVRRQDCPHRIICFFEHNAVCQDCGSEADRIQ